jgi:hypothetical protein
VTIPSTPNAATNINARGTPPELAKTAETESITASNFPRAYLTITYAKKAPRIEPIIEVTRESLIETTNAWKYGPDLRMGR